MVFLSAACAINAASNFMMNGVCCAYQMHEEEERLRRQQDAIRHAVRMEWDHQRRIDIQNEVLRLQEQGLERKAALVAERRRKQLMETKKKLGETSASVATPSPRNMRTSSFTNDCNSSYWDNSTNTLNEMDDSTDHRGNRRRTMSDMSKRSDSTVYSAPNPTFQSIAPTMAPKPMKRSVSSIPNQRNNHCHNQSHHHHHHRRHYYYHASQQEQRLQQEQQSRNVPVKMSSLIDSSDEDDDEGNEYFEEVPLE